MHCTRLDPKTRKRGLIEVPRTGVGLLGRGQQIPLPPAKRSGGVGYRNVSSPSKFPQWGPGQSPGKFGFWSILDLKNHARMVCLFLIQRPCVVNESAESADHKLNSMDSVLVDIENVVITCMWWALQPIAIWLIWNPTNTIRFSRLKTLGNKSSHFDQPWPASPSL